LGDLDFQELMMRDMRSAHTDFSDSGQKRKNNASTAGNPLKSHKTAKDFFGNIWSGTA
jgi:hypothetical protein